MSASASATARSGASLPPELVPILLVVAVAVASAVEQLDDMLFNAVDPSSRRSKAHQDALRALSCNGR